MPSVGDVPSTGHRKAAAREEARSRRLAMGEQGRILASTDMATHVFRSQWWQRAQVVAGFVGVGTEPDTRPLLCRALEGGKRLILPRVVSKRDLVFAEVTDLDQLVPASFGLLEPAPAVPGVRLSESGADVVLVPGLAFDREGRRLGYGRGYYDRALAPLAGGVTVFAGLVLHACLLEAGDDVPTAVQDVPVHCVVTEHGIHWPSP
ncbi:MAG: 5-formyltetrahydrofolate cyclo-ligase [Nannocystaceae bacterium]